MMRWKRGVAISLGLAVGLGGSLAGWLAWRPIPPVGSRGYNMPFLRNAYQKPMPVIGADPKL
jgi:hypothetical protein